MLRPKKSCGKETNASSFIVDLDGIRKVALFVLRKQSAKVVDTLLINCSVAGYHHLGFFSRKSRTA